MLSSPLLALYGVTPVYLFNYRMIPLQMVLAAFSLLLPGILIFWLINIYVFTNSKIKNVALRYLLSYAATNLFPLIMRSTVEPPIPPSGVNFNFFYPVILMLAVNTIIIILCNSIILSEKMKSADEQVERLRISHLEAQKKALVQQLHPHFLFNTLSVLKSLIKQNPDEAENYAVKLSEFLRYSIEAHGNSLVTLAEELKFATDYIELQKVRFENSLMYQITVSADLHEHRLPAFALQTLVENAIKHNSFTERKPLFIRIEFADQKIRVWNNRLLSKVDNSTGMGLQNLNDRYKIVSGEEIQITESPEEFQVSVSLLKPEFAHAHSNH